MQTNKTTNPLLGGITNTSVFHPMKGPMTTQTLRGLQTLDPFHWRGDRTNFTHFNIAFPGLMGNASLSGPDMNAYRDFINTITFEPNPNQNLDRTYPANFNGGNASAGKDVFFFTNYVGSVGGGLQCNSCHTGPPGPGSDSLIIPAAALQESQDFKVPHLRNAYQKLNFNNAVGTNSIGGFGFTHDGTDPTLQAFLSRPVFVNINSNATIKNNLAAFVQCFDTGTAPAVGFSRTLAVTNVTSTSISNDWTLLQNQAVSNNIDLIVLGTIDGANHGFLYQPTSNNYRPDSTNLTTFTRTQLTTKVQNGDTLTIMGVPPGSGLRMGIDRDEDGVLNADVPPPSLQISSISNNVVVSWPLAASTYTLQAAGSVFTWTNATDPIEILNNRNYITNGIGGSTKLYRLKAP
jgi:hypothetical protein